MRVTVDGLASPHPLGHMLPGLYHDNDLAQRFTAALDVVLAPVLATLDSSDAYVDPRLAPLDFVEWLAGWVGVELDASWPESRQRALVARAGELYAWRGTVRGVTQAVAIYTGVEPEVSETGGTTWTGTAPPAGQLPGSPAGLLLVRVRVPPGEPIDAGRLDRLVAAAKPAHIAHKVEIVEDRRLRPSVESVPEAPALPVPDEGLDLDGDWVTGDDDGITVTSARGIPPTVVPGTEEAETEAGGQQALDTGAPGGGQVDGGPEPEDPEDEGPEDEGPEDEGPEDERPSRGGAGPRAGSPSGPPPERPRGAPPGPPPEVPPAPPSVRGTGAPEPPSDPSRGNPPGSGPSGRRRSPPPPPPPRRPRRDDPGDRGGPGGRG